MGRLAGLAADWESRTPSPVPKCAGPGAPKATEQMIAAARAAMAGRARILQGLSIFISSTWQRSGLQNRPDVSGLRRGRAKLIRYGSRTGSAALGKSHFGLIIVWAGRPAPRPAVL